MTESGPHESAVFGAPLHPVNADDLKQVWCLIQKVRADHGDAVSAVSIDARFIAKQCEPGADVMAVFFRATFLQCLFQSGRLDEWREENELRDSVFQVGATFPMERGVLGFDPADFIERLRSAEP